MYECDVHIITGPNETTPQWKEECFASLASEPINIHLLPPVPNHIGQARAKGFRLGTAPYVSFVDSDDRIIPGIFQKCIDILNTNSKVDVVWTLEEHIDKEGNIIKQVTESEKKERLNDIKNNWNERSSRHIHQIVVSRREAIVPYFPLLEDWPYLAEKALWISQVHDGLTFHLIPEAGYQWRKLNKRNKLPERQMAAKRLRHLLEQYRKRK